MAATIQNTPVWKPKIDDSDEFKYIYTQSLASKYMSKTNVFRLQPSYKDLNICSERMVFSFALMSDKIDRIKRDLNTSRIKRIL